MFKVNFIENLYPARNICSENGYKFQVVLFKNYLYFLSNKISMRIENRQTARTKELLTIENLEYHFHKIDLGAEIPDDVISLQKMSAMDNYSAYNQIKEVNRILDRQDESIVYFKKTILSNFLSQNYKTIYKQQRIEVRFIHEFGNIKIFCSPYVRTSIKKCQTNFKSFVNLNKIKNSNKIGARLDFSCNCFVLNEILSKSFTSNIIAIKYNFDKKIIILGFSNDEKVEWVLS